MAHFKRGEFKEKDADKGINFTDVEPLTEENGRLHV